MKFLGQGSPKIFRIVKEVILKNVFELNIVHVIQYLKPQQSSKSMLHPSVKVAPKA